MAEEWLSVAANRLSGTSSSQVNDHRSLRQGDLCKTVGSAYVGSNPTCYHQNPRSGLV